MLPFDEAKKKLLTAARLLTDTESIDLADAFGRVLAGDIVSSLTVPPFDNAAMDGYAVRAAEVTAGCRLPVRLRAAAGDPPGVLPAATAGRIFTGAAVPTGADAVVMQEDCRAEGDEVVIQVPPAHGQWIRPAGGDIQAGQTLLAAGTRFSAAAMGLAASVGVAQVRVYRPLRVAIFFTGSELRMPGEALAAGQIYNSNRYVMRGFLRDMGAQIIDLGIVPDSFEATRAALRSAAQQADVIVTSGGMSEGDEDHVTNAVRAEGRIDVWKIASKPGKPLAFGSVGASAFIGLPGNPVSVWVGMLAMVMPFLRRSQNMLDIEPPTQRLRADFSYTVKGNRMEFVRVRRNADGGLDCYRSQDSSMISSAVWCDGLAMIAAGSTVSPGDMIDYVPGPRT
jgi:molybdopterin molybdotransferase